MTRLVVCLDGTNQTKDQACPTNISRIFDALGGVVAPGGAGSYETLAGGAPGTAGKYLAGVGAETDPVLKVLGNAFGDGIAEPIIRGYTYLARLYNPGDEIFLTGFSRGATAARALAGLVTARGLLDRSRYDPTNKTQAYLRAVSAWYAYRAPDGRFADQARLGLIGGTLGQPVLPLEPADYTAAPLVRAVGVFDTVSSLGIPQLGLGGVPQFDFSICDTALSPDVQHGFHALAADETRDLFSPTFWAAREGVVQQIFPGCHSDVGGGFFHRGLSDAALEWMLEEFEGAGLAFDRGKLTPPLAPDPLAVAQDDGATFPFKFTPRSARGFPECALASASLVKRWGRPVEMLPALSPTPYRPIGVYADGRALG